jgi:hypothetical protein
MAIVTFVLVGLGIGLIVVWQENQNVPFNPHIYRK